MKDRSLRSVRFESEDGSAVGRCAKAGISEATF